MVVAASAVQNSAYQIGPYTCKDPPSRRVFAIPVPQPPSFKGTYTEEVINGLWVNPVITV